MVLQVQVAYNQPDYCGVLLQLSVLSIYSTYLGQEEVILQIIPR